MTEHIDLTDDGTDATVYIPRAADENRKRVVALAEGLNDKLRVADGPARKRARTAKDGVNPSVQPAGDRNVKDLGAEAEATLDTSRNPAVAAAGNPPKESAQTDALPANNLLAQLHAERLARMSEASRAALRSPAKPETSKVGRRDNEGNVGAAEAGLAANRTTGPTAAERSTAGSGSASTSARGLSVLTYNLWFNEEVALVARMQAVCDTIEREGYPDLLLFQEVTQNIVHIFRQSAWFRHYHCSPVPEDKAYFTLLLARRDTVTLPAMQHWMEKEYDNSCMGRSILYTRATLYGRPLVVGTTHLESPVGPGPQQMAAQRKEQLGIAFRELEAAAGPHCDILLAGDLNWSDARDGSVRLPPRWCDAWQSLMPGQPGLTWDPVANPMLTSRYKGSRLDRMLCRLSATARGAGGGESSSAAGAATVSALAGSSSSGGGGGNGGGSGWQLGSIKMVGTQALPGQSYEAKGKRLPVLPSDHFGLLLKLLPAGAAPATGATGHVLGSASAAQTVPAPAAAAPASSAQPGGGPPVFGAAGSGAGPARGLMQAGPHTGARAPARVESRAGRQAEGPSSHAVAGTSQERAAGATGQERSEGGNRLRRAVKEAGRSAAGGSRVAPSIPQVDLSAEDGDDDVVVL